MSFRAPPSLLLVIAGLAGLVPLASARADDAISVDHFEFMRRRTTVIAHNRPLAVFLSGLPPQPAPPADATPGAPASAPPPVAPVEVGVTFDGQAIAGCTLDGDIVMVRVPDDQRLGRKKVRLTLRGHRPAEGEIEVVAETDARIHDIETGGEIGGRVTDEVEARIKNSIHVSRFAHVVDAAGERFEVEVTSTLLPDGVKLDLSVSLADPPVPLPLHLRLVTAGGKAAGSLPLAGRALLADYELRVLFDGTKQSSPVKRWIAARPESERETWGRIEKVERESIGSAEEIAAQQVAVRDQHHAVADEALRLLVEVDRAYASASRSLFLGASGAPFDQVRWREHVGHLAAKPVDMEAFAQDQRFATPRGNLRTDALEAWAEQTLVPALRALDERRHAFSDGYIAPPSPRAETTSTGLVAFVGRRLGQYVTTLYAAAHLPVPPVFADLPGATAPGPDTRNAFLAQRRLLLRTIGLGDIADAEEPAR